MWHCCCRGNTTKAADTDLCWWLVAALRAATLLIFPQTCAPLPVVPCLLISVRAGQGRVAHLYHSTGSHRARDNTDTSHPPPAAKTRRNKGEVTSYNQILGSAWILNTLFKLSVNKLGFWNVTFWKLLFRSSHAPTFGIEFFCVMIKSKIRSSHVRALKSCSMRITMQETIWWNQRWNCNSGGGAGWGMEMMEVVMIVQWVPGLQADVSS